MLQLEEIYRIIDDEIARLGWPEEPHGLYAPLRYMLDIGGKRLRPRFCLTAYNLFSDDIGEHILSPAMALEVFHSFTLIHDDIMDKADIRRGVPTVYKKWDNNTAILSGEYDDLPEAAFYNVGTIDDALAKAEKIKKGEL